MSDDIACVDFGGGSVKISRVRGGEVVATRTLDDTGAGALPAVTSTIAAWGGVSVIAIAVPGVVDLTGSRLQSLHGKYGWLVGVDLKAWASFHLGISPDRCQVHNDARAALQGEIADMGAAPGAQDAVLMVLGTGIGTAAVCAGRTVMGSTGHGGILGGHLTIDLDGPDCLCGNRGCAEALAGTWALPARAAEQPSWEQSPLRRLPGWGFQELLHAEAAGDRCAAEVVERCLDVWATLLVTLCHQYDPAVAIVSGGPMNAAQRLLPPLQERVRRHLWRDMPPPQIVVSTNPTWSVTRGLAALAARTKADL